MSWDPDSNTLLTSPPVNGAQFEETLMKLLHEFIKGWFSGTDHDLDGVPRTMPLAKVTTQQAPASIDGLGINIVLSDQPQFRRRMFPSGYVGKADVKIDFYVKAHVKTAKTDGSNSRSLCRIGADLLFSILSSTTAPRFLNNKRIFHLRPAPPRILNETQWSSRLVTSRATVYYGMGNYEIPPMDDVPVGGAAFDELRIRDRVTGEIVVLVMDDGVFGRP